MFFKICCITGPRPEKLPFIKFGVFDDSNYMEYIESIYFEVNDKTSIGYNYFICGGARGVDLDFAQAVIDYRDGKMGKPKNIKLEIAIPCKNQTRGWSRKDVSRYKKILKQADEIIYCGEQYTKDCMQNRNKYMVNKSDLVVAYWGGDKKGGTWNTMQYAKSINKPLEIINLKEMLDI